MSAYNAAEQGAVTLWRNGDCTGYFGRFPANEVASEPEAYTVDDMNEHNMKGDWAHAIMIPQGYSVKLYDDRYLSGSSWVVMNGPYWMSGNDDEEMTCQTLPSGWGDRVSSLEVYRSELGNEARGDWVPLSTHTEGIDYTVSLGWED